VKFGTAVEFFFCHFAAKDYNVESIKTWLSDRSHIMSYVRDVLREKGRDVATIAPYETVLAAVQKMHERRVGAVVVVVDDVQIVGIFTERDLLNRVVAVGKEPPATPVEEVMTDRVAACTPDTTLAACRTAMTKNKMRHLPVVDDGQLVGIISSGDILARELADQDETIRYLHEYMHGAAS
jgi:CBS domain-containing protein